MGKAISKEAVIGRIWVNGLREVDGSNMGNDRVRVFDTNDDGDVQGIWIMLNAE